MHHVLHQVKRDNKLHRPRATGPLSVTLDYFCQDGLPGSYLQVFTLNDVISNSSAAEKKQRVIRTCPFSHHELQFLENMKTYQEETEAPVIPEEATVVGDLSPVSSATVVYYG